MLQNTLNVSLCVHTRSKEYNIAIIHYTLFIYV